MIVLATLVFSPDGIIIKDERDFLDRFILDAFGLGIQNRNFLEPSDCKLLMDFLGGIASADHMEKFCEQMLKRNISNTMKNNIIIKIIVASIIMTICAWLFVSCEDNSQTVNGHEAVDLGLPSGTLWATTNVGAETPEE